MLPHRNRYFCSYGAIAGYSSTWTFVGAISNIVNNNVTCLGFAKQNILLYQLVNSTYLQNV